MATTCSIPIEDIVVSPSHRATSPEWVKSLAESIRNVGLLNPITVNEDNLLIAGRHRLEAAESVGWKTIDCRVFDLTGLKAELAEIDENLERAELPQLLHVQSLARRKEIYEGLYPGTRAGMAGANASNAAQGKGNDACACHALAEPKPPNQPIYATAESAVAFAQSEQHHAAQGKGKDATAAPAVAGFVANTAAKTGQSERKIYEDVAIAKTLDGEAAAMIADIPSVANSKAELTALSKLSPEKQREVAAQVKSGEAKSVRKAIKASKAKPASGGGAAAEVLDAKKRPVPADLLPVFATVPEFKSISLALTALLKRAEALGAGPAGAWLEIGHLKTHIADAKHVVKFGTPYIVCTYCRGNCCEACRQSGYLNQSVTARNSVDEEAAA